MGINKIGNLFAANTDAISNVRASRPIAPDDRTPIQGSSEAGDAVVISKSLRQRSQEKPIDHSEEEVRRARVTELKGLVKSGEYKPPTDEFATTLLRDLL